MPSLRGHHFVCLHFFNGEGYDEAFIKNFRNVLTRAEDEDIMVSSGADDVCAGCLHLKYGRCAYAENADEDIREMDRKALALLDLSVSDREKWNALRDSVGEIFLQWYHLYCKECDWKEVCEKNYFFQKLLTSKKLHP